MLRLRTTTGLSVLALTIGIVGTGWLSTLTGDWRGPPLHHAVTHRVASAAHPAPSASRLRHRVVGMVQVYRAEADGFRGIAEAQAASPAAPELVPLAMPDDSTQRWDVLRGHLDGRVVVHVDIDGNGRVDAASLVESSGDPVLDAHALRSVRGWRFAVPAGHPAGISGDLPMRFSSRA
ncbi:energy transducer TonB [Rhodanobacter sp. C01]|uniref:energy transducer TonB family protein n=1 Tax=Rhodanobacter sp. C01 TaxID=1945856 RepID=UPI0009856884|nr:energy transducer TonB [Rhodanobacter sp. C01]OOG49797.1 energy transducer TonB [Rhodanobacter sp. C01]